MKAAVVIAAAALALGGLSAMPVAQASARSGQGAVQVALQEVAAGFAGTLTTVTHAGDGSGRLFVTVQKPGSIHVIQGGVVLPTPFLDVFTPAVFTDGYEQGLLGLAFHPDYDANGYFYVFYNAQPAGRTVVARYRRSSTDPNRADPASATILLDMEQPNSNHNGGDLRFGPDGYLYVAKGDGGTDGATSPDLASLLGKLLRIDVDHGTPYAIPPDNPFVGVPNARPEIWDFGLRNPWRFSFDRTTGDLFIGDVGQDMWEEVDFEPANGPGGVDYGWPVMEGPACYVAPGCDQTGLVPPILYYPTPVAGSVIGGSRYRGAAFPGLTGVYFYGDLGSGQLFAAEGSGMSWTGAPVLATGLFITTMGEDEAGEIYVGGGDGVGSLFRIVQSGGSPALGIGDVTVTEGNAGSVQAVFTVTLSPAAAGPVTVEFATADDGAEAGADYAAAAGALSFAAGSGTATASVTVLPDLLDEADEHFLVLLSNVTGGAALADDQGRATIVDDDPTPRVSVSDASVVEGNAGSTGAPFQVTLTAASGRDVDLDVNTVAGTAIPGVDYTEATPHIHFDPGQTSMGFSVPVLGDVLDEPDERFRVELVGIDGALAGDTTGRGTIRDDDGGPRPLRELAHRAQVLADLGSATGTPPEHLFLVSQQPFSSYEVVVDAASGDLGSGGTGPRVELVDNDLANVVAGSAPAGLGPARSLRWENDQAELNESWYVRVSSDGCDTDCGPDDVYRLRAYDTTLVAPRFNNSVTQLTVLILQNAAREAVTGRISFWATNGSLLGTRTFDLDPFASVAIDTRTVPGVDGASGSITVSNGGPYGTLTGKAVALEPATGYSFDTPLSPRR